MIFHVKSHIMSDQPMTPLQFGKLFVRLFYIVFLGSQQCWMDWPTYDYDSIIVSKKGGLYSMFALQTSGQNPREMILHANARCASLSGRTGGKSLRAKLSATDQRAEECFFSIVNAGCREGAAVKAKGKGVVLSVML